MKEYKILADCRNMEEHDIVNTILKNRNIKDVEHFLNPVQDDLLPLDSLKNIDKAYDIYRNAIDNNLNISILFDTDTDGLTAGAILTRYTREIQKYPCECLINNGKAHGLNGQDLSRFTGTDLLIIVDSLDSTVDNYIKLKRECGVENIIVLDNEYYHNISLNEPLCLYGEYILKELLDELLTSRYYSKIIKTNEHFFVIYFHLVNQSYYIRPYTNSNISFIIIKLDSSSLQKAI